MRSNVMVFDAVLLFFYLRETYGMFLCSRLRAATFPYWWVDK
jgi:hypothetical protein